MATPSPSNRAALRAFVVIALSLIALCYPAAEIRRLWLPVGVFGYGTNHDGVVTGIDANSPAANAGMHLGDRVDLSLTAPQFRILVVGTTFVSEPGQRVSFDLVHQGMHRTVTLLGVPEPMTSLHKVLIVAEIAIAILVAVFAAALVLLQPNPITWGFFFFCLSSLPGTWQIIFSLPFPMSFVLAYFSNLMYAAGSVGLLVFAFRFLREPTEGWRLFGMRTMPYVFILLFVLNDWQTYQADWLGSPPAEVLARVSIAIGWFIDLIALFAFADTYLRVRGVERQRIQWVVIAFGISLLALSVGNFSSLELTNTPTALLEVLYLLPAIAPIAFAYAIIRHRVIDVSFVVNRALVYGVLTTLLVGALSIIDWLFIEKLKLVQLGTITEVGAAVAVGFWFNGLHKRVDWFVDSTFFRQRHKAERQLARNAAALPSATTTKAVAQALVTEPVRALSLASAALFRRGKDGAYIREESEGWEPSSISRLAEQDDHLLMLLQTENGPLSLYEYPWRTEGVPSGPAHPALALPIIVRRELAAIVFYGSHIHGEGPDPDEIKAIASLAPGAAAAYDHLEAELAKRRMGEMTQEIESLRTQLAEAQIQPA